MQFVTAKQIAKEVFNNESQWRKVLEQAKKPGFPRHYPKVSLRPKVWNMDEVKEYYCAREV